MKSWLALLGDGTYKFLAFIEMIFTDIFSNSFPPSILILNEQLAELFESEDN